MARISEIQGAVMLCKHAQLTPFIWGVHGLGKSSLIKQLCEQSRMGFVDLRCSQLEAVDIRGLPTRGEDGRTHYCPPAEMPIGDLTDMEVEELVIERCKEFLPKDSKPGEIDWTSIAAKLPPRHITKISACFLELQPRHEHGILFLDEVNRGADDVLQAIFQLVLDRKVGRYALPEGWAVCAAGNFNEGYITNGFNDAALLDRFCHMTLSAGETTLAEWTQFMSKRYGLDASAAIEFTSSDLKYLDGNNNAKNDTVIQPSRRSWDSAVRAKIAMENGARAAIQKVCNPDDAMRLVLAGLLGSDVASAYLNYDCPVKVTDLMRDGVKQWDKKLRELSRSQMAGLMWGLSSYLTGKVDDEKHAKVALDFAEVLVNKRSSGNDNDLAIAFIRQLVQGVKSSNAPDQHKLAIAMNPALAARVVKLRRDSGASKGFLEWVAERPTLQTVFNQSVSAREIK